MSSNPEPRPRLVRQFLNLLASVRERPHEYCHTIGELEDLISQLYEICAIADGQVDVLKRALEELLAIHGLTDVTQVLTDDERREAFVDGDAVAEKLIAFWSQLDEYLGFPSPLFCCNHGRNLLAQAE